MPRAPSMVTTGSSVHPGKRHSACQQHCCSMRDQRGDAFVCCCRHRPHLEVGDLAKHGSPLLVRVAFAAEHGEHTPRAHVLDHVLLSNWPTSTHRAESQGREGNRSSRSAADTAAKSLATSVCTRWLDGRHGRELSHQQAGERLRGRRRVDDDRERLALVDDLAAPRHHVHRLDARHNRLPQQCAQQGCSTGSTYLSYTRV